MAASQDDCLLPRMCPEKFVFQNTAVYSGPNYLCTLQRMEVFYFSELASLICLELI